MTLTFMFQVQGGRVKGNIVHKGKVICDLETAGLIFASDGALTPQEQQFFIEEAAHLQRELTRCVGAILGAAPAKQGGRYVE